MTPPLFGFLRGDFRFPFTHVLSHLIGNTRPPFHIRTRPCLIPFYAPQDPAAGSSSPIKGCLFFVSLTCHQTLRLYPAPSAPFPADLPCFLYFQFWELTSLNTLLQPLPPLLGLCPFHMHRTSSSLADPK